MKPHIFFIFMGKLQKSKMGVNTAKIMQHSSMTFRKGDICIRLTITTFRRIGQD